MNRPKNDPERLAETLSLVCEAFGVTEEALKSRAKHQELADPRSAFYYVTHRVMQFGSPRIARWFGSRHHGAVVHGAKRADGLIATEKLIRSRVEWIVSQMKERNILEN